MILIVCLHALSNVNRKEAENIHAAKVKGAATCMVKWNKNTYAQASDPANYGGSAWRLQDLVESEYKAYRALPVYWY